MESKLSLENITMLLRAADKIRKAGSPELREGDSVLVRPEKLSMIRDTMQIISGYLPETHKLPFKNALKSCDRYCSTYRNLKKHLREINVQEPDVSHVLTTLKVIMPMLENQQMIPLRKAVSILEAMQNQILQSNRER